MARICPEDQKSFEPQFFNQIYCCQSCRKEANRKQVEKNNREKMKRKQRNKFYWAYQ